MKKIHSTYSFQQNRDFFSNLGCTRTFHQFERDEELNNIMSAWMKFPMDWLFKDTKRNHSFPRESIQCFHAMETQFKDFSTWPKTSKKTHAVYTPDSRLSHPNNWLYLSFYTCPSSTSKRFYQWFHTAHAILQHWPHFVSFASIQKQKDKRYMRRVGVKPFKSSISVWYAPLNRYILVILLDWCEIRATQALFEESLFQRN